MFCDKCGTPFVAGAQYCAACGRPIAGVPARPTASANAGMGYVTRPSGSVDGRVGRNINLLAGLWLANGILRLMGVAWWMMFRRFVFDSGWPFGNWGPPGFRSLLWGGIFSSGVMLAFFGIMHLLLAWGLYERQPWARLLGIVMACFALVRIPFGTALGIYTLWVLAPEPSGREYDAMAIRSGTPVSVAR